MTILDKLIAVIISPIILLLVYGTFIWMPVNIYNEAECLREGYPENKVSIGLERYCMTLDGVITVRVDKQ